MANVKISDLTGAASASGTQEFEVNDSGTSKKVTGTQLATFIEGEVSSSPTLTGQVSLDNGTNTAPSLTNTGDTNTGLYFPSDDTVGLAAGGGLKLSANASGIDVTGTVTADGLTVDGTDLAVSFNGSSKTFVYLTEGDTTDLNTKIYQSGGNFGIQTISDNLATSKNRLKVDHSTGDISFYEDTGTTPKFFWDASAESLGIGGAPDVWDTFNAVQANNISLAGYSTTQGGVIQNAYYAGGWKYSSTNPASMYYQDSGTHQFHTAASGTANTALSWSQKMTIDSSGNVGIGTGSPDIFGRGHTRLLGISTSSGNSMIQLNGASGAYSGLELGANSVRYGTITGGATDVSIGTNAAIPLVYYTNNTERMRINSSGNVGIGTSSAAYPLTVNGYIGVRGGNGITFLNPSNNYTSDIYNGAASGTSDLRFKTQATERMRIDSSGNLLVGTTDKNIRDSSTAEGMVYRNGDSLDINRSAAPPLIMNRVGNSDGDIALFRKDGSTVGSLSTQYSGLNIDGAASRSGIYFGTSGLTPRFNGAQADNTIDVGTASQRFDDIYATNGTIQTSDRNEKQDIEVLSDAETRVAQACKGLLRKFRWKDAVAEKGDDARIHFGIIAQDLQDAFTAEGLDAGRYAMFISSTWWETQTDVPAVEAVEAVEATYDEDGNELTPAVEAVEAKEAYTRTDTYETLEEAPEGATERTRLGVRYPELLAFIIAAI
ncbi:putative structural protein [Roseobacter phage CRP-5]|uniref:Putative structural protein n=1 Tax=Roseobacter phage CRP-5 TaxID=2559284 RepID=A0A646QWE9_9CAUD|nr:putative structural protein [Roseobacter phage CRP-5]